MNSLVENTKLCDFTSTNNDHFDSTHIVPPTTKVEYYEIGPTLLNLVLKD